MLDRNSRHCRPAHVQHRHRERRHQKIADSQVRIHISNMLFSIQIEQSQNFSDKKSAKTLAQFKNTLYLCIAFGTKTKSLKLGLSYGVMVALQFLVLPVLVRIQVRQHKGALRCSFFYFPIYPFPRDDCGIFPQRIPHLSTLAEGC